MPRTGTTAARGVGEACCVSQMALPMAPHPAWSLTPLLPSSTSPSRPEPTSPHLHNPVHLPSQDPWPPTHQGPHTTGTLVNGTASLRIGPKAGRPGLPLRPRGLSAPQLGGLLSSHQAELGTHRGRQSRAVGEPRKEPSEPKDGRVSVPSRCRARLLPPQSRCTRARSPWPPWGKQLDHSQVQGARMPPPGPPLSK